MVGMFIEDLGLVVRESKSQCLVLVLFGVQEEVKQVHQPGVSHSKKTELDKMTQQTVGSIWSSK